MKHKLCCPTPRSAIAYDALGSQPPGQRDFRPPPNWDAGFEFSDGAGGGGPGRGLQRLFRTALRPRPTRRAQAAPRAHRREPQPERGTDHHAKIELELLDAYNGAERNISLRGAKLDDSPAM
jgi:curved DNA-binding protein